MLDELIKELNEHYSQAAAEVQKKVDKYFEKYQAQDIEKQADLQSGKLSKEEYQSWQKGKIFTGKRWEDMQDTLAKDLAATDQIAADIINNKKCDAYALNHNYGTYEIEHQTGISTSFTLYDHDTVERLIAEKPEILPKNKVNIPKDQAWNKQLLRNAVTQGVLQGESIPKIAKRMQSVTDMDKNSAIRNSRTAMTGAQNAGRVDSYKRAQDLGIDVTQQWMSTLDARTRNSHRLLMGEKRKVGEKFSNGLRFPGDPEGPGYEVYNCFIPETNVAVDSEIIRSYKHHYEGKVVSIKSARGISFTCTPNHPILTDRGWVAAKFLKNGDHLIVTNGINNEVSRRNPNINHRFPRFDTIHELFNEFGTKRTCNLGVNFHGDIPTSDVEIITEKGFLWNNGDSGRGEGVNKLLLKDTNSSLMRKGSFMKHLGGIARTTLSNICSMSKTLFIFFRSLCHSIIHRFGPISNGNIVLSKNPIDNLSTDSVFNGEPLIGLTGKVFTDDIIDIEFGMYSGHVYNLQTENNYYFINNIISQNDKKCNDIFAIAHNCRCTLVAKVDGYGPDVLKDAEEKITKNGETFEQWQKGHSFSKHYDETVKQWMARYAEHLKKQSFEDWMKEQTKPQVEAKPQAEKIHPNAQTFDKSKLPKAMGLMDDDTFNDVLDALLFPDEFQDIKKSEEDELQAIKKSEESKPQPQTKPQVDQKALDAAEQELDKAKQDFEDAKKKLPKNKTYSGIWKDDVTLENYEAKKDKIAARKQYFQDEINSYESHMDDLEPWQMQKLASFYEHIQELDEFEKLGQEYSKAKNDLAPLEEKVKDAQDKVTKLIDEAYTQERKDNAKWFTKSQYSKGDKYYDASARPVHAQATSAEHSAYMAYTDASGGFNRPLAGFESPKYSGKDGWNEKYYKGVGKVPLDNEGKGSDIKHLTSFVAKSKTQDDIWVQTAQDFATLEGKNGFLGVPYGSLQSMSDAELQQFVGVQNTLAQFISGSINRGGGSYTPGNMRINIYLPRGSEALYVLEDGTHGKSEHEIILQRGGTYRVSKIYWGEDAERGGKKLMVDLELRLELGYNEYGQ